MNAKQKNTLKNQIQLIICNEKLTIEDIKIIEKDKRQDSVNNKLLGVNKIALEWALTNKIIYLDELKTNEFFTKNKLLNDVIPEVGIGAVGVGGAAYAFNVAAAPGFLGLGGGIGAIGVAGAAAIAAPIAFAGVSIFTYVKYKENKEVERLEEYFEIEKRKILDFYFSKINKLPNTSITISTLKKEKNIQLKVTKKIVKQNFNNQKLVPSSKRTVKKENKPNIKQIEKDIDYDKCVVRYDGDLKVCTIKYEDTIRGKKDGLHGQTFKDFVHKIPPMIGHDIFNMSKIEIIFIGKKSHLSKLEDACKTFENSDDINIKISFRDISKKSKKELNE